MKRITALATLYDWAWDDFYPCSTTYPGAD